MCTSLLAITDNSGCIVFGFTLGDNEPTLDFPLELMNWNSLCPQVQSLNKYVEHVDKAVFWGLKIKPVMFRSAVDTMYSVLIGDYNSLL